MARYALRGTGLLVLTAILTLTGGPATARAQAPTTTLPAAAPTTTTTTTATAAPQQPPDSPGLYVTIRAETPDELEAATSKLRSLLGSLLLDAQPATFRSLQGWITTLPLGLDRLRMQRTFDTSSLAAAFPFASAELAAGGGVLYGRNLTSQGLVVWDRFAQDNYNSVVLARSGAGKSYLTKLELLRWLYTGVEAAVIDPQDEYARLAEATGGTRVALGSPGVRLNPFDLDDTPDALTRRSLSSTPWPRSCSASSSTQQPPRRSTAPSSRHTPPAGSAPTRAPTAARRRCSPTWPPRSKPTTTPPRAPSPPGWPPTSPAPTSGSSTGQPPPDPKATWSCSPSVTCPKS